jgi:hypothetical protein
MRPYVTADPRDLIFPSFPDSPPEFTLVHRMSAPLVATLTNPAGAG